MLTKKPPMSVPRDPSMYEFEIEEFWRAQRSNIPEHELRSIRRWSWIGWGCVGFCVLCLVIVWIRLIW
jgi:hypothetical protein